MTVPLIAALSVAAFLAAFWLVKVLPAAVGAIAVFRHAMSALRDASLSDDDRERIMQKGSVQLLRAFAAIVIRSAVALAAALLPVVVADWLGLATSAEVFRFLTRLDVIAVAAIATTIGYCALARLWQK